MHACVRAVADFDEVMAGESASNSPVLVQLSDAAVVPGAIDVAGCHILPVINRATVLHGQVAVVACTHHAYLAMNASLLPRETHGLTGPELTVAHAIGDASVLVEFTLPDGLFLCSRRRGLGLGKCKGGRCNQGRHKHELRESHGVSPSVTVAAELRLMPLTPTETQDSARCSACIW
jgi:hypothetical protein